jgi:hypothetical protein
MLTVGGTSIEAKEVGNTALPTVIDCTLHPGQPILSMSGAVNVSISWLIITGGQAPSGGAMSLSEGSKVRVFHSSFQENIATFGGVLALDASAQIEFHHCNFTKNSAATTGGRGGVVLFSQAGGTVLFNHSLVADNTAGQAAGVVYYAAEGGQTSFEKSLVVANNGGSFGGVVFHLIAGGLTSFFETRITQNVAGNGGVVAMQQESNAVFSDCEISDNIANRGAVLYHRDQAGIARIHGSLMTRNVAFQYGGIAYYNGGNPAAGFTGLEVNSSRIINNQAEISGGVIAMINLATDIRVLNSTISANWSPQGGVIWFLNQKADESGFQSTALFISCSFVDNQATEGGENRGGAPCAFVDNIILLVARRVVW